MPYSTDLQLAQAVTAGDAMAWNAFVQRYGDLIMSAVVNWCENGCRVPRSQYDCILRSIQADKPEPAEGQDTCREGLALYRHACEAMKPFLARYEGRCSLGGYLRLALREVRRDYLDSQQGRLSLPAAIAALPPLAQGVYRLGSRLASREAVATRLGVSQADVLEAEHAVRAAMRREGKEWWTLATWGPVSEGGEPVHGAIAPCSRDEELVALVERRLGEADTLALTEHVASCVACAASLAFLDEARKEGLAPVVAAPAWVNRDVMDPSGSSSPEPGKAGDRWTRKVFSQPGWLAGLAVGGVAAVLIFSVLIPHQELARLVKEPGDQLLARADHPLEPTLAGRLDAARDQLAKGKVDAAIQNLETVLASRPENQEVRWLLASTYDRLGDRPRAARQYRILVDVADREAGTSSERITRARERLDAWEGTP